jgi:hypothetical protein
VLGAIATYLMVGMAFAFAYRTLGAVQGGPFFGSQGEGTFSEDPAGRPLHRQPSDSRATTGLGEFRRTLSGALGTMAPHDRRA